MIGAWRRRLRHGKTTQFLTRNEQRRAFKQPAAQEKKTHKKLTTPARPCPPPTRAADEDYRGNVGVILFNHSDVDFAVEHGDRIAQLVLEVIRTPEVVQVESLEGTARGEGGFGSTGVAAASGGGATAAAPSDSGEKKQRTGE